VVCCLSRGEPNAPWSRNPSSDVTDVVGLA
jgi:hypothetical protein